jgi:dimethylhistidine N-methyltransferase
MPNTQNVHRRRDDNFGTALAIARDELAAGLQQRPAAIAPKYFYNPLGSKLFEAICLLEEYYLTRVETGIYTAHAAAIAAAAGPGTTLIDLGAGNCGKADLLLGALQPRQYVPVDISVEFLRGAAGRLQARYPGLPIFPLGFDFMDGLHLPPQVEAHQRLFFYPGSSIGNFTPAQAGQFLTRLRAACGPDGALLIGVDLVKPSAVLDAAYNDALGVTAAFNLNLLTHVNELLGSDFALAEWRHLAFFNAAQSRIEMHLQARRPVTVRWPGAERIFAEGECIHTENSYKYTARGFAELLETCGFGETKCWTDEARQFLVCHARAC